MSVNRELEQMLKQSDHLMDIVLTHQTATAEIIAAFVHVLVETHQLDAQTALRILENLDSNTQRPSVDGARSRIVRLIRESMQKVP